MATQGKGRQREMRAIEKIIKVSENKSPTHVTPNLTVENIISCRSRTFSPARTIDSGATRPADCTASTDGVNSGKKKPNTEEEGS